MALRVAALATRTGGLGRRPWLWLPVWRATLIGPALTARPVPGRSASRRGFVRIHIVNPSHFSFGTGFITPRWMYVLAAATPSKWLAVGTGGMVILVGEDLAAERILEVRTWDASVGLTVSLLKVCWSRKAVSQEEKDRYVVEGKFLFGPYVVSEKRVVSVAELTSEAIEKDRGNPGIEHEVGR